MNLAMDCMEIDEQEYINSVKWQKSHTVLNKRKKNFKTNRFCKKKQKLTIKLINQEDGN